MVKRLIVKLILEVGSSLTKSFIKAYQQTAKQQRGGSGQQNKFQEFVNSTLQSANLAHRPMTKEEALKILNLPMEKANAEEIIKIYWRQFHKNDPVKGGSFYIQSVLHNAKVELMKDFPDVDEAALLKKIKEESGESNEEEGQEQEKKEEKEEKEKEQQQKQ